LQRFFDEAWERSVVYQLDHTVARVVALEDLIAIKLVAGRPQDLADVDALRALLQDDDSE
jgi:hypothetical protein